MLKNNPVFGRLFRQPLWRLAAAAVALLVIGYFSWGRRAVVSNGTLIPVRRGPLPITVLEGGSVEAMESQEIRSQIKGYQGTKILSIVEEGYLVTEEDIKNGKVLVELDASEIRQKITTEEIQFQSTLSGLIEAQQAYDIQLNQNKSDLKAAEQKARFARLDVEKYMSKLAAQEICDKLSLKETPFDNEVDLADLEAKALEKSGNSKDAWPTPSVSVQAVVETIAAPPPGSDGVRPSAPTPSPASLAGSGPRGNTLERRPGGPSEDRGGSGPAASNARESTLDRPASNPDGPARRRPRGQGGAAGDIAAGGGAEAGPRRNGPRSDDQGARPEATLPTPPTNGSRPIPLVSLPPTNMAVRAVVSQKIIIGDPTNAPKVDFTIYAKSELLGDGAAQQQLRKLEDDFLVATQELSLARIDLDGSQKLFAKQFISSNELNTALLTIKRNDVKVKTAQTALELFIKYEFTKAAEEFVSKYDEALRQLDRARKEAISKLAQSRARLKSAESRYRIEAEQRRELFEQYTNCVIRAQRPGLVVYGGGDERRFFGGEEQIREGATVRERQSILTIPDMTHMSVKVRIHESHIKKVAKGLKAKITVDAYPDKKLEGEVIKVGVLPDSQSRWMSPDMKLYVTSVSVEGAHEWLKPGMSAKVEIMVKELPNVLYVPIQAVSLVKGQHICFIPRATGHEQRPVEIGEFNDDFIEIKKGLKETEKVLLRAPEGVETDTEAAPDKPSEDPADVKPAKARPSPAGGAAPTMNRPSGSGGGRDSGGGGGRRAGQGS